MDEKLLDEMIIDSAETGVPAEELSEQETDAETNIVSEETDEATLDEIAPEEAEKKPAVVKLMPQVNAQNNPEAEQSAVARLVAQQEKRAEKPVVASVEHGVIGEISEQIQREEKYRLSPEEKKAQTLRDLARYKRMNQILWATVESIVTLNGLIRIGVMWNGIEVVFSKDTYFEPDFKFGSDYDELTNEQKSNREMAFARYQLGAHIPFCVDKIVTGNDSSGKEITVVAGSRCKAMKALRDHYFFNGKETVNVGDLAKAHVLAVRDDWALVEVLGCEYRLDAYALNDECVQNCMDWVKSGDTITVRIRKIHVDPEAKDVRITVTGRLFVAPETINSMQKGGTYIGNVDAYNAKKKTYSVVLYNGVLASVPESEVMYGYPITLGDRVSVKVKRVTDTHVIGAAMKI